MCSKSSHPAAMASFKQAVERLVEVFLVLGLFGRGAGTLGIVVIVQCRQFQFKVLAWQMTGHGTRFLLSRLPARKLR